MDLMTAIATMTKAMEALKIIREIDKDFDAATYKARIAELMSSIADGKMALLEAKEAIENLNSELASAKRLLVFRENSTIRARGFTYERFEDGTISHLPFCPKCELSGQFARIIPGLNVHHAQCCNCHTDYAPRHIMFRSERAQAEAAR
jgi:hypothetical protein